ncbi:MAG: RapZ C-terminal domain-containing protein [Bacteroidota bacterium]
MEDKQLIITVNSFSYRRGIPYDNSGNGGGYVFDCRGILNPGKFEKYMMLTGKDPEVIDFFEKNTKIHEYLKHVYQLVKINIENYMTRDFSSLMVNFGCTGGQHRSVFCAEWLARQLQNNYNVLVKLNHLELTE